MRHGIGQLPGLPLPFNRFQQRQQTYRQVRFILELATDNNGKEFDRLGALRQVEDIRLSRCGDSRVGAGFDDTFM